MDHTGDPRYSFSCLWQTRRLHPPNARSDRHSGQDYSAQTRTCPTPGNPPPQG